MTRKHLLRLICFLLSATLLLSTAVSASAGKLIGNKIKNFKTKTLTGETFELNKALEENAAVIIDLWFIDCDWCAQTFYYWEQCDSCYRGQVAFLALNITDKIEDIADYAETRGFSDDIVFARDAGIRSTVRANTFPRSILVGKGGVILDDDLDSSCFQAAIRYAAGLTDQDYADIAEWV